jgi:tetratricopeptide (TPR) repeat protein
LLAGGLYWGWSHAGPEPPRLEVPGIDPVVLRAVEEARAGVRRAPHSAAAWGRLGMVLQAHQYWTQARFCLAQAERLDPKELRWPYFQGLAAYGAADGEGAVAKLEQAVALCDPTFDAPRLRLAELLLSLNRLDEAESHFRHILRKNLLHPRAQLGLARIFYQRGDLRASLGQLTLPQSDSRTEKGAWQLLAQIHCHLGQQARAEEAQRRATDLAEDPPWPDRLFDEVNELRTGKQAWIERALLLSRENRNPEAIALLQQTVATYPEAQDTWMQLGLLFLMQKNQPDAEKAFRRATELAPGSPESVFYLGNTLVLRGDLAGGIACFRKAADLKPDYAAANYSLGNCLVETGDNTGAIEAYRAALRYEPALVEVHVSLATLLAEKGQYAEAWVHAAHALRLEPSHPRALKVREDLALGLTLPFLVP